MSKELISIGTNFTKKGAYEAFRASPQPRRMLWVRPNAVNKAGDRAVQFGYLKLILTDGNGFFIGLTFGDFMSVQLHGRNLQELFSKLLEHEVEWVQEFDPNKWPVAGDNAACITGIKVTMEGWSEALNDKRTH